MTEIKVLTADDWSDYRLLDSGSGRKLEQVGKFVFDRPEPQALWRPRLPAARWAKADAVFAPAAGDDEEAGRWKFTKPLPEQWPLSWDGLRFICRPTPFRHLAFFPEQSVHWRFAQTALKAWRGEGRAKVLNLFGYTGLASLVAARAGAEVTHVDASKKSIGFARENQAAAGLGEAAIRWIVDDAHGFVRRELRRGKRYDGVILDPPKFGRGPQGETWRLEEGLSELLADCCALTRRDPEKPETAAGFVVATVYAVRLSVLALAETAREALGSDHGAWEIGEMALPHAGDARLLPTAIFARWRG